jgi:AcrR family transcriptional regulator
MGEETQKEQHIVAAARVRFGHYGFKKTTMAEIAGDCRMSAANIYRYFPGKKALLAEIAKDYFSEVEAEIERCTVDSSLSPHEKIRQLVLISLNYSFEYHSSAPHINEAINIICAERNDLILEHRSHKEALLIDVLTAGVKSGFFIAHDIKQRAETILNGTILVHPLFLGMFDVAYLRQSLIQVVDMMTEGIISGVGQEHTMDRSDR